MRRGPASVAALACLSVGCAAAPPRFASAPNQATRSAIAREPDADSTPGYAPPPRSRPSPERQPAAANPAVDSPASATSQPSPPPAVAPSAVGGASVQSLGEASVTVSESAAGDERERVVREARIGAQVQRIREEQIRLASNPGVCHDVCFAAGSICLAAQEVCRLTGDEDARCTRARAACTEAGHQRDGACPVCPPTH